MAKIVKIAESADLVPGRVICLEIEGERVAVFNVDGTYYAIDYAWPHSGGPLSEGAIKGSTVTCPWHGAGFDLRTGRVLCAPANDDVRSYRVIVDGKEIKIEI